MTVDISVITHGPEGIRRVEKVLLPPIQGVRYVVSWQDHQDAEIPQSLAQRADVAVFRNQVKSLSENRNHVLAHCNADLIIIADDDLTLLPEGISELCRLMEEHPEVDLATFRSDYGDMNRFPSQSMELRSRYPHGYNPCSIEIAFRGRVANQIRCCPEFGLNSPRLHGGEDEMLVYGAIKRGLRCRYFPVTVCRHPGESTGTKRHPTKGNIEASGAVIALQYPGTYWYRLPLKAWRLMRSGRSPFWKALRYLISGAIYGRKILPSNRDTLW